MVRMRTRHLPVTVLIKRLRFDSNYHFVVPEFSEETDFKLNFNKVLEEYREAKDLGVETRPVVLGPITFLALGKAAKEARAGFEPLTLLPALLQRTEMGLGRLTSETMIGGRT